MEESAVRPVGAEVPVTRTGSVAHLGVALFCSSLRGSEDESACSLRVRGGKGVSNSKATPIPPRMEAGEG